MHCGLPVSGMPAHRPRRFLVWSIILFFCFNVIGTPLAVAAGIYAAIAIDPSCENPSKACGKAKALCIAGTCADALTLSVFLSALIIWLRPGI